MSISDLAKFGIDTDALTPGADYVPDPVSTGDGIHVDVVYEPSSNSTSSMRWVV